MDNNRYIDAAERIKSSLGAADTAIILGSGLGGLSARLENAASLSYSEIPGFPVSTAPGHAGRIYCGFIGTKAVYCLSGRFHYYEGYSPDQVVFAVRALHCAGVKTLIVTNAAGGINTSYIAGEFMLISDHINFLPNPLVGRNNESFGPRFPDMTYAYDPLLRKTAKSVAENLGITLHEGVYIAVPGPSYETPAEIRAFRTLGADAVGMSTVPEVIAANHCGMRVLAFSLISNMAAGILKQPLTEEEVLEAGRKKGAEMQTLICQIIKKL